MSENNRASQVDQPVTPPKKKKEKIVDIPTVKLEEKKDFEKTFNPTLIFKTFSTINEPKEGPSIEIIEEKKSEEEITEEDLDAELEAELNELNE
jgi:hypothetical protein